MTKHFIYISLLLPTLSMGQDIAPPSFAKSHFFQTLNLTIITDTYQSPIFKTDFTNGVKNQYSTHGFCLVSVTYEPRLNFFEFNERSSLSVNLPVTLGIGPTLSDPYKSTSDVSYITNFFHVHIPVLIHYNNGFHSTLVNEEDDGYTVGLGAQVTIAPLLLIDGLPDPYRRVWIQPVIKTGYKRKKRGRKGFRNFDITAGYFNGWCFKMSFGYILNY